VHISHNSNNLIKNVYKSHVFYGHVLI
jgi:hypothetical protein